MEHDYGVQMKLEQYFINVEENQLNNPTKNCKPRGKVYDRLFKLSQVAEFHNYIEDFSRCLYGRKHDDYMDTLKYTYKLFGIEKFKE